MSEVCDGVSGEEEMKCRDVSVFQRESAIQLKFQPCQANPSPAPLRAQLSILRSMLAEIVGRL